VGAVIPDFAGGRRELEIVVGNGNFRGMGQTIGLDAFVSNEVADSYMMFFVEPRVFGSRWAAAMTAGTQREVGNQNRLSLRRPFFSLATPWAYEFGVVDESSETLLYDSGLAVSDYYRKRRGVTLAVFRSFGAVSPRVELGARYDYRDDDHRQAAGWHGVLPPDKKRAVLTLEASAETYRFVEDTHFNLMGPVEDLKLGLRGVLRAGGAAKLLGSDRNYGEVGAGARWFQGSPARGYVLVETDVASRVDAGRFANTVFRSTLALYRRVLGRGLLAGRAGFAVLDRMEDPDQLLLDSPSGLRGYAANSFDGTRRFITNLEWRQPLWDLEWVSVGSVLFTDGGSIWTEPKPASETPFLVGAGGGVRLGFPGFLGAPVVRLDWGYGFDVSASEVSFGFGQRF
jgi:outer membrane protein assembly factor BamA